MSTRILRSFAPLSAACLLAVAGCGGAAPAQQPTGPAPVVVTAPPPAAGGDGSAAPAAPKITKSGPNVTPEGVVFNYQSDMKNLQIYLAGNFNGWKPSDSDYQMKDDDGDGVWSITVKLAPGTYQYKYVIDGKWTQDQYAPAEAPDGYGASNSKFDVP